jgi:hypothetical protein
MGRARPTAISVSSAVSPVSVTSVSVTVTAVSSVFSVVSRALGEVSDAPVNDHAR